MGIATFPAGSSGLSSVVKSIQRGTAASAGNITITAVDTTKTQVNSFSTGSAGYVQATGSINAANGSTSTQSGSQGAGTGGFGQSPSTIWLNTAGNYSYNPRYGTAAGPYPSVTVNNGAISLNAQNIGLNSTSLTGGSTSLTSAQYGAYLTSSTNIYATGPCQYEVVEYY